MSASTSILLPSKLNIVEENDTKGTYEIQGLYPGYGHTLGNSLRRIILSSLPGAAITQVKIEGADHEYATLDGVKEDVLHILLNLKQVRFRTDSEEPQVVTLKATKEGIVTAKEIDGGGAVEVLNPDHVIGEITSKKGALNIEMTVQRGIGFVPREMLTKDKMSVGTIAVDAAFTPIRKVRYEVENMRVGDRTDHNLLRVSIETDGSLTPLQALEDSIMIMLRQMRAILDLEEAAIMTPVIEIVPPTINQEVSEGVEGDMGEDEELEGDMADVLKTRVDSLELSTRTANALNDANIRTVGGLVKKDEKTLLDLPGLGAKGVDEIKDALKGLDLELAG